jgi:ribosomal protein L37AE/L43A
MGLCPARERVMLASMLWAQEMSVTQRVGCDMMSGGGKVPRAMLTANTWSCTSCKSIGNGGAVSVQQDVQQLPVPG